jgi:phospholipid/cholesterol/gamma-HCH transport system ATP-binding protein
MGKEAIIQVRNLVARYGDHVVLDNVSFEVYRGEILAILGRSGCGKSTLLRHMIGLDPISEGEVTIAGLAISSCSEEERKTLLKRIGVLFQGGALIGSMTLGENIALPIALHMELPKDAIRDLVRIKLCMVGLEANEFYFPSELSGGMKKRAGLARAIALSPDFLFLDEPTGGLDPPTAAQMENLVRRLTASKGTTTIMITHELESVMNIAQRAIMLDESVKGIVADGDPRVLKKASTDGLVGQFFNRHPLKMR